MATQDGPEGQQHGKTSLTPVGSEQPVVLDGRLDEESWGKANVVRTFAQRDPDEGMPATEKTEVRALYDKENLYFGVQCFDICHTMGVCKGGQRLSFLRTKMRSLDSSDLRAVNRSNVSPWPINNIEFGARYASAP